MLRILIMAAFLGGSTLAISTHSFAAEEGEKKLSKKERKALKKKNAKLGRMSSMCIGSLAFSTLDDETIRETPEYKASSDFWSARMDEAVSSVKEKKRQKARMAYIQQGSSALTNFGNGNLITGGKKAAVVCRMMEAEGMEGPTASMMLGQ